MKLFYTITLFLTFFVLFHNYDISAQVRKDIHPSAVIVKFKANSEEFTRWKISGRNSQFLEFFPFLEEHTAKPYISNNTIAALRKKQSHNLSILSKQTLADNLERISVFYYLNNINPEILAKKLSELPFVEYAEPLPVHNIVGFPNDSLAERQYYLNMVKAVEAWDFIPDDGDPVVIGIVDTGVDHLHVDLIANIWNNPGETGNDSLGNDKSSNGIDDDDNGYIDDWHGWDFVSSDSTGQDNDPAPGNEHGTHVAGIAAGVTNNIIGIAGVAKNAKILPVKAASDSPAQSSIYSGYEGLLYAAIAGADVINCSWGGGSRSTAEQETIDAAVALGSVIVAAAGNSNKDNAFFPASYKGVISVAALNSYGIKAWFSNYNYSVGISAPGLAILSTIPENEYQALDGTSMASPVVAGVAAMVVKKFPDYTPLQVIEHLKATAAELDSANYLWKNKLGKGLVDALRAVTETNPRSIILKEYAVRDENGDGALDVGEVVEIDLTLYCPLKAIKNVNIKPAPVEDLDLHFINPITDIGDFIEGEEKSIQNALAFVVPEDSPLDYNLEIELLFEGDDGFNSTAVVQAFLKPSFRTMSKNNIAVTLNSAGNIGYNDFPANAQGIGFKYKNNSNLLFEGALMIAKNNFKLSNCARGGGGQELQDKSFAARDALFLESPGQKAPLEGTARYYDFVDSNSVGVDVHQKAYQFVTEKDADYIIINYDIINTSDEYTDSLFVGLYFDWDIGASAMQNIAEYKYDGDYACVYHTSIDTLPMAGVKLLTNQKCNFFAIDNNGNTEDNPGVYDSFTREEKIRMMSGGIARVMSNSTDASMVIAAGPIRLQSGDTVRVSYSLFSGFGFDELKKAAENSLNALSSFKLIDLPEKNTIIGMFPNPVVLGEESRIEFALPQRSEISLSVYNALGQFLGNIESSKTYPAGNSSISFTISDYAIGAYFIKFEINDKFETIPFRVIK